MCGTGCPRQLRVTSCCYCKENVTGCSEGEGCKENVRAGGMYDRSKGNVGGERLLPKVPAYKSTQRNMEELHRPWPVTIIYIYTEARVTIIIILY